jgi:hypothetical protein
MTYNPGATVSIQTTVVTVVFGTTANFSARTTVTGLAWVTAGSILTATPGGSTADHSAEDAAVEGLTASTQNLVPGVGFDLVVSSPLGSTGSYSFNVLGL